MDLDSWVACADTGRGRQRAAALAVGAVMTFLLGACTYETSPVEQPTPTSSSEPGFSASKPEAWGPGSPYYTNNGIPYVGESTWPSPVRVASFTEAKTGVVYVDADSSKIVWESWEHDTKEIGRQPWRNAGATPVGRMWGEFRDIVGNPESDVVSWVETTDGQRGDIVVVQPSTGRVLARTPIEASPEQPVVFASVDDHAVHYATGTDPGGSGANENIWVWQWASGEDPHLGRRGVAVLDVSGDTWAVAGGSRISFERTDGSVLSSVDASYGDRTYFGGGLSPGGRFWFAPAYGLVVETSTGKEVRLEHGFDGRYGWTGPEELTMIGPGLSVCSAITGNCDDPIDAPYTYSAFGLPLN
ncbi:hypothetical protein [Arthrobacter burdickii]|uniref:Uncharacterized protein n=1 Tax=Arthrobacter burdickii TaxID=3035920 RepID=A0ABT8K1C0_9MICC|nr:hypothetical protein [Arthrobacter burdickii]MDN4611228.1 hypothetical protein [Arthrobacter burdickii]